MREGRKPLPLAFQYLILKIWRPCDLNLAMISSLALKCQHFKLRGLQFHFIKWLKNEHPKFKDLSFKSQGLHIIRIKYWNATGSGSPPSLNPSLWNIGILLHKQPKRRIIMHTTVHIHAVMLYANGIWFSFMIRYIRKMEEFIGRKSSYPWKFKVVRPSS